MTVTVEPMPHPKAPTAKSAGRRTRWIVLIHQLPPTPAYLRVRVRRRLHRLGAYSLKQTVYVLPNTDEALEDFQWLRQEIEAGGGSAVIGEVDFVEGISDEEIEAMLVEERHTKPDRRPAADPHHVEPGRTWVTRKNVFVDRIASAWLIRRFIDPRARFKFVAARGYKPRSGELRFDMTAAEYTHVGDECTFQTLVRQFHLRHPALAAIGEIVHDIDCKDDRFNRPETSGVASLIRGLTHVHDDDTERLARGGAILDDLYANYSRS
jgi:hypothetical protein